jgi:hypothetical protein
MRIRAFIFITAIVALALPTAGRADTLTEVIASAECTGEVATPGDGICTATFELAEDGFVSNVDTHGNFHEFLSQNGGVRLTWIDPTGSMIWRADCPSLGASAEGIGPFDVQSASCTNDVTQGHFVAGIQTLLVEAATTGCLPGPDCTFHGKIKISATSAMA